MGRCDGIASSGWNTGGARSLGSRGRAVLRSGRSIAIREYAHLRRCVTRGRGDLTQRSAGKELIESTDRDMAGQGIRRPERFADMLAPGAAAPQIVTPFSHRNLRLDLAAVAVHRGPYNRMNEAHDAIRKWMAENRRQSAGHSWEIRRSGAGSGRH